MKKTLLTFVCLALSLLLMTGCASDRLVDSEVTAFAAWPAAPAKPGSSYRFERLPSQAALDSTGQQQSRLEAIAATALAKVGMLQDANAASYSVQLNLSLQVFEIYDEEPFGFGNYLGHRRRFGGLAGFGPPMRFPERNYQQVLSLQVRELSSQKVVFETTARQDGPWSDTWTLLPAVLDAALLGFPQPPMGPRRVSTEIPR